ncbi:MAG: M23 family metallopeptidase [Treponema sp.]|nr:M23 family metallopeptidase [Treponema sp.]
MSKINFTFKKIISIFILLSCAFCSFATSAVYNGEDYSLKVNYNDILVPGDAVFVRLNFQYNKNHKKNKTEQEKYAVLQLYQNKKLLDKSVFYNLGKAGKKSTQTEFLTGIPLSTWLGNGEYTLKVVFAVDDKTSEFDLPVTFSNREFFSETIELNETNTAIKTDTSPERVAQIDKLNNILGTIMPQDVFSTKPFEAPNPSTRYTSYFGDRRVYAYSNGKSSTSLHYGNDYGIPTGSEVRACQEGKVVLAENRVSTGWSIVIEHLPGLYSLYYHLDSMNVKEGDMVKLGDLIGKSGCTGLATGPHLHWEVRLNMCAVRPEFFFSDFTFSEYN